MYTKNIRVYDHTQKKYFDIISDEETLISKYKIYFDETEADLSKNNSAILFEIIKSDTDGDGYLSCNDAKELAVYDFSTNKANNIALKNGQPIWAEDFGIYGSEVKLMIGQDENGDGLYDASRESAYPALFDLSTGTLTNFAEFRPGEEE